MSATTNESRDRAALLKEVSYVTVVSGLPRSGTSMMMRMLEHGGIPVMTDGLRRADESNPRGYYEFEPVKRTREDASWLRDAAGKAVKMVYRLLYDLPDNYEYRVLVMRREMSEILASQKSMLQRNGQAGDEVADEQLAALFQKELTSFQEWVVRQPHFRVLEVSYNELLQDPHAVLGRVEAFLDHRLVTNAMAAVVEPNLYRNRQHAPVEQSEVKGAAV